MCLKCMSSCINRMVLMLACSQAQNNSIDRSLATGQANGTNTIETLHKHNKHKQKPKEQKYHCNSNQTYKDTEKEKPLP